MCLQEQRNILITLYGESIVELWESLSKITKSACDSCTLVFDSCKIANRKHRCCSAVYCAAAMQNATEHNINLPIGSSEIPLLDNNMTCTAHSMLRPFCTLYSCDIESLGFIPNNESATKEYFRIKNEITK